MTNGQRASAVGADRRTFGKLPERKNSLLQQFANPGGSTRVHLDQKIRETRQVGFRSMKQTDPTRHRAASFSFRTRLKFASASSAGMVSPVR